MAQQPYFADETVTLHHGDALEVLRGLSDASVDSCVTSPPYFGLRDYGQPGQYGLEATPAAYVEVLRLVFSEVRRILTDDGTLWLNIGDSYAAPPRGPDGSSSGLTNGAQIRMAGRPTTFDRPRKNLLGLPWRVAFALQDDGWILRNAIIWHKPNAMPESVTDRLSNRYEHVFLFSKSRQYWFDLDPIREPSREREPRPLGGRNLTPRHIATTDNVGWKDHAVSNHPAGKNPGDVWTISTQPFSEAHFAVMPAELAERCAVAGCPPGGVVLDPFSGSGTTGLAAQKHGRRYVGIDLNREYLDLSLRTRLRQAALDFNGGAA